jgi:hypothetical protein
VRDLKFDFNMKKINVYGVKMTSVQEMKFSQYLNRSDTAAMNTLTEKERFELTKKWLNNEIYI